MKYLNGVGVVAAPEVASRLGGEVEILGQMREYPGDEEWNELVREYESVRVEQAERGWVLRAPAPLPGVRPYLVDGMMAICLQRQKGGCKQL